MIIQEAAPSRLLYVRLNPGDDLLHGIQEAAKTAGIRHGAILAGVGSLSTYHFHVVSSAVLPPDNAFVRDAGPFDILTVTGAILDGRVHAHVTFSNTEVAMGGHLEEGSTVLTFAIILLADTSDGVDLTDWDRVGPRE